MNRITLVLVVSYWSFGVGIVAMARRVQAVLWDVDGTLSDSFSLGFESTKTVLARNGKVGISDAEYHEGTKFTTPRRLAWHVTGNPDDPVGIELGRQFDQLYVDLVSLTTAPLYAGILPMLERLQEQDSRLKQGALSNACGAYVKAVLETNNVNTIFEVALGTYYIVGIIVL